MGKNATVVVLGEMGRSPRMRYHALSLANAGFNVNIIGYGEEPKDLTSFPNVNVHSIIPFPELSRVPKLPNYFLKALWQSLTLFVALATKKSDFVIVQNPPAIPTLVVCWLYCLIFRVKFIIDWHNYAYTIMGLTLGINHVLVVVTKYIESYVGRKADANFCVTNAMKHDLEEQWHIKAVTLYDRPPLTFHPIELERQHDFLQRLGETIPELLPTDNTPGTLFTERTEDGKVQRKANRPALLVSSTSWTEDEDFGILLAALQEYESACEEGNARDLPKIVCVITGNGPLKEHYCDKINEHVWNYVCVRTAWLEAADYPLLLASADLGVCLHYSSSGLDLPMKVVDMFGSGLPVCAYNFKSLPELVKHNENSLVFNNGEELSRQLQEWFDNFPTNEKQQTIRMNFKTELKTFQNLRWEENWTQRALPIFQ